MVALDGKYRRFQSLAGLDSAVMDNYMDRSAITFEVWVDGQKRWDSGPVRNVDPAEPPRLVDIDVAGAKELELVVVPQDVHGHVAQQFRRLGGGAAVETLTLEDEYDAPGRGCR